VEWRRARVRAALVGASHGPRLGVLPTTAAPSFFASARLRLPAKSVHLLVVIGASAQNWLRIGSESAQNRIQVSTKSAGAMGGHAVGVAVLACKGPSRNCSQNHAQTMFKAWVHVRPHMHEEAWAHWVEKAARTALGESQSKRRWRLFAQAPLSPTARSLLVRKQPKGFVLCLFCDCLLVGWLCVRNVS
jgi:hypothetical protein